MKASYKLQLEQEQRRLGMSHKELNKYDKKHNDINLINYLMSLNPVISAAPTGFWGIFVVQNVTVINHRYMDVYLAYDDVPLTSTQRIHGDSDFTFNIAEADRLPLPSSTLQLKITMQNNTQNVELGEIDGFQITDFTSNPLDEENTLSMLVNENNYDDGQCSVTFEVTYEPPGGGGGGGH